MVSLKVKYQTSIISAFYLYTLIFILVELRFYNFFFRFLLVCTDIRSRAALPKSSSCNHNAKSLKLFDDGPLDYKIV